MNENRRDFLVKKCNSFRPAAFSKEYLFVFLFSLTACESGETIPSSRICGRDVICAARQVIAPPAQIINVRIERLAQD